MFSVNHSPFTKRYVDKANMIKRISVNMGKGNFLSVSSILLFMILFITDNDNLDSDKELLWQTNHRIPACVAKERYTENELTKRYLVLRYKNTDVNKTTLLHLK